jgi:hypothetical protein
VVSAIGAKAIQAAQAVHECIKLRLVKADDFKILSFSGWFISQVFKKGIFSLNARYKKYK